ncbi:MAG: hypothetical protein Hyperionvirus4_151 [Hyperionvirus sp.]|uniref:Uncharacterized protein n=1 Tax=Hyperionvirus sp. TaxID=2487770 RepID=A0A3G5A7F6_9VIRU|nr:MAG: hypothetical protein Hyperionvirus4_151 [Hyperionvirus sp.]
MAAAASGDGDNCVKCCGVVPLENKGLHCSKTKGYYCSFVCRIAFEKGCISCDMKTVWIDPDTREAWDYCSRECSIEHNGMLPLVVPTPEEEKKAANAARTAERNAETSELIASWRARRLGIPMSEMRRAAVPAASQKVPEEAPKVIIYSEATRQVLEIGAEYDARAVEEIAASKRGLPPIRKPRYSFYDCVRCSQGAWIELRFGLHCSKAFGERYYCGAICRKLHEDKCVSCRKETVWIDPLTRYAAKYCSLNCLEKHTAALPSTETSEAAAMAAMESLSRTIGQAIWD